MSSPELDLAYNIGTDRIENSTDSTENAAFNSSAIVARVSVAAETCSVSRNLATDSSFCLPSHNMKAIVKRSGPVWST
jgi:hypothetical protein